MESGMEKELNRLDGSLSSRFLSLFLGAGGQKEEFDELILLLRKEVDEDTKNLFCFILDIMKSEDWLSRVEAVSKRVKRNEDEYYNAIIDLSNAQKKLNKAQSQLRDVEWNIKSIQDDYIRKVNGFHLKPEPKKPEKRVKPCYVYIMKTHHDSRVKIGISNTPVKREATLRSDEDLYLYETKKFKLRKDALMAEKYLHDKFNDHHTRGEWFDIPEDIIEKGLASMLND